MNQRTKALQLAALMLLCAGAQAQTVQPWTTYQGNAAHTGHVPVHLDAAQFRKVWESVLKQDVGLQQATAADGMVFVSQDGYFSGQDFTVLNALDGKTMWKFKTENYVHCTPSVADGVAYIAGCDEVFRGIRISDGREVLRMPGIGNTASSPALVGNSAYFGNFSNEVLSLNLRTRRRAWVYMHRQRQFPFYSSPALAQGRIVLGGRDKMVHCINATTGKAIWTFTTRARVESSPAVAGGRVYVGSNDGRFYILDMAKGTKLWEFNAGGALSASPAIANGRIVIGDQNGKLYCFG